MKSSFSHFKQLPDLLEIQKTSFNEFLQKEVPPEKRKYQGLEACFIDIFGKAQEEVIDNLHTKYPQKIEGIISSDNSLLLQYLYYSISEPQYTIQEAKDKALTYSGRLTAWFRLYHRLESGELKKSIDQEVFLCDLPLMTETASFIINGAERTIVTQIHRSPGVIFEEEEEGKKTSYLGKKLYVARIIPYRGAWIEFEFDLNNALFVRIDKRRKIPATILFRAIGYERDEDILKLFYEIESVKTRNAIGRVLAETITIDKNIAFAPLCELTQADINILVENGIETVSVLKLDPAINDVAIIRTLKLDHTKSRKEALGYIYKILRSQEFLTEQQSSIYFENLLFNIKHYDLTKVGRYKINKKLRPVYEKMGLQMPSVGEDRKRPVKTLTKEDIVATVKYLLDLNNGISGELDDIDHLGNRRVRPVGELLENQIRFGMSLIARSVREQMNKVDKKVRTMPTPRSLINVTPLIMAIRHFFGTSQLSQFLDQTNPLAELTHKRRLSALGPGGLTRKRAGFEIRDVHHTHYGRICPIETPEGGNIGLITSLATYARINEYGLIETPYRRVKNGVVLNKVEYLTADQEDEYVITQANTPIDKDNRFIQKFVPCRYKGDIRLMDSSQVDYMDISPMQIVSVSSALIPFLEHDDANRALMGSNMQRQAVPLFITEPPLVMTGIEEKVARDSYAVVVCKTDGEVIYVNAEEIAIYTDTGKVDIYKLTKYDRSNQDTCIDYIPIVSKGQKVKKGQVIADGSCTSGGCLALGRNLLTAFMSWEGYNFEDAIIISDRLVKEDIFTSIHIQEFQIETRDTRLGPEEITRDIPNVSAEDLLNLDENGIIRVGAEVKPGDILVGKTTPKGEQAVTVEERLLKVIFGKKAEEVTDNSLRVPPGVYGKVIKVIVSSRREKKEEKKYISEIEANYEKLLHQNESDRKKALAECENESLKEKINSYFNYKSKELKEAKKREVSSLGHIELPVTVNKVVRVRIASRRRIQVGDKLAGRHGNKGVVAKILQQEDMPYLPDGTPIDVIFSPLSLPSRMNVGQLLECMVGWSSKYLNRSTLSPVFEGISESEIFDMVAQAKDKLKKEGFPETYLPTNDCRITLYDGRTGEPFIEKVTVGYMYLMKLNHLVEDKIHARSTGPYSLITRQPLGGRAQFGGQRFGEMEVWATEGYGAAYTLQEFLTVKSDDVLGRTKVYEAIIQGKTISEPSTPESFKVLVRELQGLGLNAELISTKSTEEKKEVKREEPAKPKKLVPIT